MNLVNKKALTLDPAATVTEAQVGGLTAALAAKAALAGATFTGNVGVGVAPTTKVTALETVGTSPRGLLSMQIGSDANGARVGFSKARGTAGTPTTVVTADTIGRLMFRGYDGSNYLEMGSIEVGVSGTVALTRVPTFMAFSTATDAAPSVLTTRMTIDNAGLTTFAGPIAGTSATFSGAGSFGGLLTGTASADITGLLSVGVVTGSAVSITTKLAAGTSGSPLYTSLIFRGYLDRVTAKIFSYDQSGSVGYGGGLRFFTSANMGGADNSIEQMTITSDGNTGFGTTGPGKRVEINHATGGCLRLTYNDADGSAANKVDLDVSSSGDLTIAPSGADVNITGLLTTSGSISPGTFTVATLPTVGARKVAYASDGRKAGEGAGVGTGVLVFSDAAAWRAVDTGLTVAA